MSQETSGKLYVIIVILSIAIVLLAAGLYSFVVAGKVSSFNYTLPEEKSISVSGSASTFIIPDTASISLGVLTQAPTAKDASEKNAASMNAVISALKNQGLQDRDIRTSYLSIQPVYNYPKDGGIPTIIGYSASNNVQVTTMMLDKLGDIVDKAVASGANQVSGISFIVSEGKQKQMRDQLLTDAVKDADEKANKLAANLKVRIVGVRTSSISEGGGVPAPLFAEKAATPVMPGESEITLTVQVTYMIE